MSHLLDQLLTSEQLAAAEAADARQARALAHYSAMARAAITAKHGSVPEWVDALHVVGGVQYAGCEWTVAADPESWAIYGIKINEVWHDADSLLNTAALDGLQAALDAMPGNEADDGPADFDADHAAHLAGVQYERQLDARAAG